MITNPERAALVELRQRIYRALPLDDPNHMLWDAYHDLSEILAGRVVREEPEAEGRENGREG